MIAPLRPLLAATAALALSGCVAAAIPVLAAGGLVQSRADRAQTSYDARPRVALPAEPPAIVDPGANPAGPVGEAAGAGPGAIIRDYTDGTKVTVTSSAPPAAASGEPKFTYLPGVTSLPAPSGPVALSGGASPAAAVAIFAGFAREQAAVPATGAERHSALLADSSQLSTKTKECSIHPAAVLIDLDPAGGVLDPDNVRTADQALVASLAELRRDEITIGWVSGLTADRAGALRKALAASGLDPEGRDQLLLLRLPDDRKQTRRVDFAQANCVLAIAGDERADFDELFGYLRDPNAATALDGLIGKRWFLVPAPLT
ncbi:hypothetical protein ACWPM1_02850 [Tsuneonella sp. HG249]